MSVYKVDIETGMPEDQDENSMPLLEMQYRDHDEDFREGKLRSPQVLESYSNINVNETSDDQSQLSKPKTKTVAETAASIIMQKKWQKTVTKLKRLNIELLEAIKNDNVTTVERLLRSGANVNATCQLDLVSGCHIAALAGADSLSLLIQHGADKHRLDRFGRSPLHLAAFAGNARQMAILLGFPEDILDRVDDEISLEVENEIRRLGPLFKGLVNVRCGDQLPEEEIPVEILKDVVKYENWRIKIVFPFPPGWTPLHVAASCARRHCTRLLLASGADPNICDVTGRTALDVTGIGYYHGQYIDSTTFTEVVKILLEAGGTYNTMKFHGINDVDTPLHTAVELSSTDTILELLKTGVSLDCLNRVGLTPLHICVREKMADTLSMLADYPQKAAGLILCTVDFKNREGLTVLHAAVEAAWMPGVHIALEAGADVTLKINNGETVLHLAAAAGNAEMLSEILSVTIQKDFINFQNNFDESALFKAISKNHIQCVKILLDNGASIETFPPSNLNLLHLVSQQGNKELLRLLLKLNEAKTKKCINTIAPSDSFFDGFGPLHLAIVNDHKDCVDVLLRYKADIKLRTSNGSTPLHIAASRNNVDIVEMILAFEKTTINEEDNLGWLPIHTAAYHRCRDVIILLLKEGSDLSSLINGPRKCEKTVIDMLMNNLNKPTEFLEDVFDSYIYGSSEVSDPFLTTVTVDYSILMSKTYLYEMRVIEALLNTGNRYDQYRLLVHPLIESFLYLKWKALLPLYYIIILLYAFFVNSLTFFIVSVFHYKDNKNTTPTFLDATVWGCIVYVTICLILLQELLCVTDKYFFRLETWVKMGSLSLGSILPPAVFWSSGEWIRHVSTLALLLSWSELMFLLSRFPNWGYYVYMFARVASNVVKILVTFVFLVIGFALSFMVQFHSREPFESPWAAFVKTMVMMTSEFDYMSLFDNEQKDTIDVSFTIVRLVFFIFLILAAVALMNLIVGVAVNDINNLKRLGNIERLVKQVEFLSAFKIVESDFLSKILPHRIYRNEVRNKLTLYLDEPSFQRKMLIPKKIQDAVVEKATQTAIQNKQLQDEVNMMTVVKKIGELQYTVDKNIMENSKAIDCEAKHNRQNEIVNGNKKRATSFDNVGTNLEVKDHVKESDLITQIEALNIRIEQMALDIHSIKEFVVRLKGRPDK